MRSLQDGFSTSYLVSREAVAAYHRDGHVSLRDVADRQTVERFAPAIRRTALAHVRETRPLRERDTYGRAFLQVGSLRLMDGECATFVTAQRFAEVAARLMGVDGVRVYNDQALFKEPGGGHTPWHQDQVYWPLDTDSMITMWMPLVDVSEDMGSMSFVSGSFRYGDLGPLVISDASQDAYEAWIRDHHRAVATHGALRAGDATFHAGWTLHSAPANPTSVVREVMTVIYFADGARLLEPTTASRANDLRLLFPGQAPGDLPHDTLHPLVYKA